MIIVTGLGYILWLNWPFAWKGKCVGTTPWLSFFLWSMCHSHWDHSKTVCATFSSCKCLLAKAMTIFSCIFDLNTVDAPPGDCQNNVKYFWGYWGHMTLILSVIFFPQAFLHPPPLSSVLRLQMCCSWLLSGCWRCFPESSCYVGVHCWLSHHPSLLLLILQLIIQLKDQWYDIKF